MYLSDWHAGVDTIGHYTVHPNGMPRTQKLGSLVVGAQLGLSKVPSFKSQTGQNITLHSFPADRTSTHLGYLNSALPFIQLHFSQTSLNTKSEYDKQGMRILLVVVMRFASPLLWPLQLAADGHSISCIYEAYNYTKHQCIWCCCFLIITGSHGRVWMHIDGTHQRQACIQTLEPENWMWEVEHFGHATRKSTPLSSKDMWVLGCNWVLTTVVHMSLGSVWYGHFMIRACSYILSKLLYTILNYISAKKTPEKPNRSSLLQSVHVLQP